MLRLSWIACAICAATILLVGSGSSLAATSCTISQVKISQDMKRLVVKTDAPMKEHVVSSLDKPPRLIIDMTGVKPGAVEPTMPAAGRAGLEVRLSGTGSGSRLVLDFGGSPLPQYKIRRVDKYLMVFLGDWTPPPFQVLRPAQDALSTKPVPQPLRARGQHTNRHEEITKRPVLTQTVPQQRPALPPVGTGSAKNSSGKFVSTPGALTIKSAQVIGDSIVLQVAKRERPGHICRLELGIDFDRKRLNLAHIESLTDRIPVSTRVAGNTPLRVHRPVVGSRIGPRKTALEYQEAGWNAERNNSSNAPGIAASRGGPENRSPGPRKHYSRQPRVISSSQSSAYQPLFGFWSTAATMFQENRGNRPRSIFSPGIGWGFDPSEID